jgi:hypothetical protein
LCFNANQISNEASIPLQLIPAFGRNVQREKQRRSDTARTGSHFDVRGKQFLRQQLSDPIEYLAFSICTDEAIQRLSLESGKMVYTH